MRTFFGKSVLLEEVDEWVNYLDAYDNGRGEELEPTKILSKPDGRLSKCRCWYLSKLTIALNCGQSNSELRYPYQVSLTL